MNVERSLLQDFLTDVRMRASNDLSAYVCADLGPFDDEPPDPADVHEEVREMLAPFFEEIRERIEGPKCPQGVHIGNNASAMCRLLVGHPGECEPCVGRRMA